MSGSSGVLICYISSASFAKLISGVEKNKGSLASKEKHINEIGFLNGVALLFLRRNII